MKFKKIPEEIKKKEMNKILSYIRENVRNEHSTDDDLYNACHTAGFMLYEFMRDYIEGDE
jgi:hypothetical protein